ncbi:MAG TPA: hypothetical protein VJS91_03820 [Nitrososphaeraceae archaeon]|nr:hypothetical protein [Nitrososphaeraceae archaeon]
MSSNTCPENYDKKYDDVCEFRQGKNTCHWLVEVELKDKNGKTNRKVKTCSYSEAVDFV